MTVYGEQRYFKFNIVTVKVFHIPTRGGVGTKISYSNICKINNPIDVKLARDVPFSCTDTI